MPRPPLELAQVELPVTARGYSRPATDQLLKSITLDYDEVWREAAALRQRLEENERREHDVAAAIAAAERFAVETRRQAKKRAREIVKRADAALEQALGEVEERRERLATECEELTRERARMEAELQALRDAARAAGEQLDAILAKGLPGPAREHARPMPLEQRS